MSERLSHQQFWAPPCALPGAEAADMIPGTPIAFDEDAADAAGDVEQRQQTLDAWLGRHGTIATTLQKETSSGRVPQV